MAVFENREAWYAGFKSGWLAHYETTGEIKWSLYEHPRNAQPVSGPGLDLRQSRLLLISTSGGYLPVSQPPYDAENDLGDYSIRLLPTTTPFSDIAYAHTHYDHTAVNADPQVLLPLRHLDDMVHAGRIGALTRHFITFMGYQPDVTRVLDETIPAIIDAARTELADAALLVPA
jgi:D-proline reductase (dithiol) PrdB